MAVGQTRESFTLARCCSIPHPGGLGSKLLRAGAQERGGDAVCPHTPAIIFPAQKRLLARRSRSGGTWREPRLEPEELRPASSPPAPLHPSRLPAHILLLVASCLGSSLIQPPRQHQSPGERGPGRPRLPRDTWGLCPGALHPSNRPIRPQNAPRVLCGFFFVLFRRLVLV